MPVSWQSWQKGANTFRVMATVAELWDRIHVWLEANAPQVMDTLKPGATEEQLKILEEKLQLNDLPDDFKDFYRIHDGSSADYFFGTSNSSNTFHSIEDILDDWSMHKEVNETQDNEDYKKDDEEKFKEIQSIWMSTRWIPFGADGCGNYLFLDLAPSDVGTFGQVIQWYHDGGGPELLASSFTQFLEKFVNELEDDKFEQTLEDGFIRLMHKELED